MINFIFITGLIPEQIKVSWKLGTVDKITINIGFTFYSNFLVNLLLWLATYTSVLYKETNINNL